MSREILTDIGGYLSGTYPLPLGEDLEVLESGATANGVLNWKHRGSQLYEQGGGGNPNRMFYKPAGDRFEILNNAGTQFVMSLRGPAAAMARTVYMSGAMVIGTGYFNGQRPDNGLLVQGRSGFGPLFGNVEVPKNTIDTKRSVGYGYATLNTSDLAGDVKNIYVDASGGAVTVTLPTPSTVERREYVIKKIDASANAVTIQVQDGSNIDTGLTYSLPAQNNAVTVQATSTQYYVIAKV